MSRPDARDPVALPGAGEHGGDGPAVAAALGVDPADLLDLSQSLNPFAPDPAPVVARHLDHLARYPEPSTATAALAAAMGVAPERLLLTNGGAEAIALVAAELGSGRIDEPDFGLYRRHLDRVDPDGPRFRSNPHNPSGLLAAADEHADVWDEAFYPLATGRWTRGDPGALVVGSLTKLLACPGLRVGYVLAPDADALAPIARRQPAWALNGLAAGALADLLAPVDLPAWSAAIAAARADLVALLAAHGLPARPSDAPWVLVDVPTADQPDDRPDDRPDDLTASGRAAALRTALAGAGVVVRDCRSFGLPHVVRIGVTDERGRGRLARALDQVLPSAGPATPRPPAQGSS